ncbi:hypothetical protein [Burkholderia pyrrocinia]|uniref:hypothetical protein n=1 Tax=Burkholderia pyrrocinia TaxID=60550 RepID=UPI001BCE5D98|nr:hypothetical protein [Burkholderia pyrrocinia]QVN22159.1 hypothetical protein JYG32_22610 [Burkholderia pyrrocinia]
MIDEAAAKCCEQQVNDAIAWCAAAGRQTDAVRWRKGFGALLQGRRAGSDEALHGREDVFAAVVNAGGKGASRLPAATGTTGKTGITDRS